MLICRALWEREEADNTVLSPEYGTTSALHSVLVSICLPMLANEHKILSKGGLKPCESPAGYIPVFSNIFKHTKYLWSCLLEKAVFKCRYNWGATTSLQTINDVPIMLEIMLAYQA